MGFVTHHCRFEAARCLLQNGATPELEPIRMNDKKNFADRRILLVKNSRTATEWLSELGHEVSVAVGARDAIELACEECPDCVVLDLAELSVEALQIARRLRQLQLARQPLLVATAMRHAAYDRVIAEDAGIDLCLELPMEIGVLAALLNDDLTRRAA